MSTLKLKLRGISENGNEIETALLQVLDEAAEKRIEHVEIVSGAFNTRLKKRVLRFLDRPEIRTRYNRLENPGKSPGKTFLHFRHSNARAFH